MGKYHDEVKTCENLAKEFFVAAEFLVASALMKDNKQYYLNRLFKLINKYKPKMVSK